MKRIFMYLFILSISVMIYAGDTTTTDSGVSDPIDGIIKLSDSITKNGPFNVMLAFVIFISCTMVLFVFKEVRNTSENMTFLKSSISAFIGEMSAKLNKILEDSSNDKLIPPYAYQLIAKTLMDNMMKDIYLILDDGVTSLDTSTPPEITANRIGNEIQEVHRRCFQTPFATLTYERADKVALSTSVSTRIETFITNIKVEFLKFPAINKVSLKGTIENMVQEEQNELDAMLALLCQS